MPYAFKLLSQELETYMNIGMRIMTENDLVRLNGICIDDLPPPTEEEKARGAATLTQRVLPEPVVPEYRQVEEGPVEASPELLMKLGALPPATPRVSDSDDIVVDGTGVQGAIQTAANVAASMGTPGVVPGSLVQTAQGPVFQPNPTTVTVVPPAKTIQVIGGPEEVVADETLSLGEQIPQALPVAQVQQQPVAQVPVQVAGQYPTQTLPHDMVIGAPVNFVQPPIGQLGGTYQQPLNMGSYASIYASSIPQPAQMYTSGVPGAPPTIAVTTDPMTMGHYAMGANVGPRPMRPSGASGGGTRRRQLQFGGEDNQGGGSSNSAAITVTVTKGN
jgi:hypothetical protein